MKLNSDRESHRASEGAEHKPAKFDVASAKFNDGRRFCDKRAHLGDPKEHDGDATTSEKRGDGPRHLGARDDDV